MNISDPAADRNVAHSSAKVHRLGAEFRVKAAIHAAIYERVNQPPGTQHRYPAPPSLHHASGEGGCYPGKKSFFFLQFFLFMKKKM